MAKKKAAPPDDLQSVRAKLRAAAEASEMTQQQIGEAMGYSKDSARQGVSRLLSDKGPDPRLGTVLSFCKAVGANLKNIL